MSYEELSLEGLIREIADVTNGPYPRKFCFVLGAGASKTSGIRMGQELIDIWDKELKVRNHNIYEQWLEKSAITEKNKYQFYSQYYDRRFGRQPSDGYNYLEKMMSDVKPSIGYVMLAYLLNRPECNVVITTNFDHLIEDAVNYYTQAIPLVIGHESLARYITARLTRPTIIKIHRDLLFEPKNKTEDIDVLHENWNSVLSTVFREYHPIFVGYAGYDNSLMDFLDHHSREFRSGKWCFPYWTVYKEGTLSDKAEKFLNTVDGYLIRHDGFDDLIVKIASALGYKMPLEEDFIRDAKARYRSLSGVIDDYSEEFTKKTKYEDNTIQETSEINQIFPELQRKYIQAVLYDAKGDYDKALALKKELIQQDSQNARYFNSLGITYRAMDKLDESIAEIKKAITLDEKEAIYHCNLGVTLHEKKDFGQACEEKQTAVNLSPETALFHFSLSLTLRELGQDKEADDQLQLADQLDPSGEYKRGNFENTGE